MTARWVSRWRLEVSKRPILPGVWKLRGGGFVASAQVRDPLVRRSLGKRAKYKTIFRVLRNAPTAKEAFDWLMIEKRRVEQSEPLLLEVPVWKDFALSVLEHKIAAGDMQSAAGIAGFKGHLTNIIKTNELELSLPDELVEVLREHIATIEAHPIGSKSDLLFPSLRTGGRIRVHA